MKLVIEEDTHFVVFLNHLYIKDIDFEKKEELEEYFRTLFLKLKNFYHITINGYYNIHVYLDSHYGAVLDIEKEELEYFDEFENQVDMRIMIHKIEFLYELKEYELFDSKYYDIYFYHGKWYIKIKKIKNETQLGKLIEHAEIHYQDENDIILKYAKKI